MAFTLKSYAGAAQATDLAANITNASASCTVRDSLSSKNWTETSGPNAGQPLGTSGPFVVVFDRGIVGQEEKILCSSISGTAPNDITINFTTRGYDGTTAGSHSQATNQGLVFPVAASVDLEEANQAVLNTIGRVTTKGDLLVATAANVLNRLAKGADGTALIADSTQTTGMKWGSLSPLTLVGHGTSFTAAANTVNEVTASCTVTLPTPTANAQIGIQATYAASGASPVTITAGSGTINGPGCSGVSSILLGTTDAFVILEGDGTNWIIIGGQQDSGWLTIGSFTNSWTNGAPAVAYRLVGDRVYWRGNMSGGASGSQPFTIPAGYRHNVANALNISLVSYNSTPTAVAAAWNIVNSGANTVYFASGGLSVDLDGVSYSVL